MFKISATDYANQLPDMNNRNVVDFMRVKNFFNGSQIVFGTYRVKLGGHDFRNGQEQVHNISLLVNYNGYAKMPGPALVANDFYHKKK
jgi:hypothetical protein